MGGIRNGNPDYKPLKITNGNIQQSIEDMLTRGYGLSQEEAEKALIEFSRKYILIHDKSNMTEE